MNPYEKAIAHFGVTAQMEKTVEELDELKAELWEWMNSGTNYDNLLAEIADVCNMIVQLQHMLCIESSELSAIMAAKMERTLARIEMEKEVDVE